MSHFQSAPGTGPDLSENEHFRGVSSSAPAAANDPDDKGNEVIGNNETIVITVVGPSSSQCIDIASNLVSASTIQSQPLSTGSTGTAPGSSTENFSVKKSRVKTEPANGYLQFIQARKKAGLAVNPNSKVNFQELRSEWREFSEDQKSVYKKMAQKEKIELGDNFRKNRSRKIKEVVRSKPYKKRPSKKSSETKVQKRNEPKIVNETSLSNLMKKYKDIDTEIKVLEEEVENLRSLNQSKSVDLAVGKARLHIKSENVSVLKEKLTNMLRLHSSCNLTK